MLSLEIFNLVGAKIQKKKLNVLLKSAENELEKRKIIKRVDEYLVECSFVDERAIKAINKKHRKKNKPTDVISLSYFSAESFDAFAGEIFICVPVAETQAKEIGHSLEKEFEFLFVHGLLHIFGFDHGKAEEKAKMFTLTDRILVSAKR
jgi:probable rRNA maturation factor